MLHQKTGLNAPLPTVALVQVRVLFPVRLESVLTNAITAAAQTRIGAFITETNCIPYSPSTTGTAT
jgi:hypothetical protein